MSLLILLRHGQSLWNAANLFTGWVDIPLSQRGVEEALTAGQDIKGIAIDKVYTSTLIRSKMTAMLALLPQKRTPIFLSTLDHEHKGWNSIHNPEMDYIEVEQAWELNERMYGELQGLNKAQTKKVYGEQQVQVWRRSYTTAPPGGESLKVTAERALPYFKKNIVRDLEKGLHILISAHGNSLRAIIQHIDGLSEEKLLNLEIPTGKPIIYRYESNHFSAL